MHVEGQSEEAFVNRLLSLYLAARGYESVSARLLGNARQRSRRGGIRAWTAARKDILGHLKEDKECISTTMVDYYGLPPSGDKAWPGRAQAATAPASEKAPIVESALLEDISSEMGGEFYSRRFVPFVVMHEFEGLLFSDCAAFARGVQRPDMERALLAIRNQFATPEEINDSPVTAPSKRVEKLIPDYVKPLFGVLAASEIGLQKIADECPHFRSWLTTLEVGAARA